MLTNKQSLKKKKNIVIFLVYDHFSLCILCRNEFKKSRIGFKPRVLEWGTGMNFVNNPHRAALQVTSVLLQGQAISYSLVFLIPLVIVLHKAKAGISSGNLQLYFISRSGGAAWSVSLLWSRCLTRWCLCSCVFYITSYVWILWNTNINWRTLSFN